MRFEAAAAPADPRAHCFDLIAADRGDAAIDPLTAWVRRMPNDAVAWQLLGNAFRAEQRGGEAQQAFEQFAALRPNDAKAILALATIRHERGLPAAELFGRLIAGGQRDADLVLSSVAALSVEGHVDTAEALLQRVVGERPDWLAGHEALASLRWRYGRTAAIDAGFAEAARTHDSAPLAASRARMLAQTGDVDRAIAILAAARVRFGALSPFDVVEAGIAQESGDVARADALFRRVGDLTDIGTRIAHVRHCVTIGAWDRAQALLDPLLTMPAANHAWPWQSIVWRLRGDARAAWLDGSPPWHRVADLDVPAARLTALATFLRRTHTQRRHPLEQSPRHGTQTEGNLFDHHDPAVQTIRAGVVQAVRDYAAALPYDAGHPFLGTKRQDIRFAGSWSILLGPGGHHRCHTHPKGWMSGVVYLDIPAPAELGADLNGALVLGLPPPGVADRLTPQAEIRPAAGRIVLFPSTTWHGTVPFDRGTRLTIAFDVAPPR